MQYHVTWEIDIEAESLQDAAKKAWRAMRAWPSIVHVFSVTSEDEVESDEVHIRDLKEREETDAPAAPAVPSPGLIGWALYWLKTEPDTDAVRTLRRLLYYLDRVVASGDVANPPKPPKRWDG